MTKPAPIQIIADKGGVIAFAAKVNKRPATVRMWQHRKRIPRAVWPEIIEAYPDLTLADLKATETAEAA